MDQKKRPTESKSRKLPRPSDLKSSLNNFLPGIENISANSKFPVLIPIPSKDAKALGLKIPEASSLLKKKLSSKCNSTSKGGGSRGSCCSSSSSRSSSCSKEDPKTLIGKNYLKELENYKDSRNSKDFTRKIHKTIVKNPRSLEDTGRRSLKNLSSRNTRSIHLAPNKNFTNAIVRNIVGVARMKQAKLGNFNEPDTSDRHSREPNADSMRQLYSISDSWSSDSVASESDNCTCCHASNPCPIHGKL